MLYVHHSDMLGVTLIHQFLIETENYSEWNRSMKMPLLVKNKIGFIDGKCTNEKYKGNAFCMYRWERYNTIVQSWIMIQLHKSSVLYSSNAQKVWAAFKDTFDKVSATKVCHVNREIGLLNQEISSLSIYYSKLNDISYEFESVIPFPGCDCVKSRLFVEFLH